MIYWLFLYNLIGLTISQSDTECPYVYKNNTNLNKNTLRIMQYNVEWLYIDHYEQFDCPGSQCTWKND